MESCLSLLSFALCTRWLSSCPTCFRSLVSSSLTCRRCVLSSISSSTDALIHRSKAYGPEHRPGGAWGAAPRRSVGSARRSRGSRRPSRGRSWTRRRRRRKPGLLSGGVNLPTVLFCVCVCVGAHDTGGRESTRSAQTAVEEPFRRESVGGTKLPAVFRVSSVQRGSFKKRGVGVKRYTRNEFKVVQGDGCGLPGARPVGCESATLWYCTYCVAFLQAGGRDRRPAEYP